MLCSTCTRIIAPYLRGNASENETGQNCSVEISSSGAIFFQVETVSSTIEQLLDAVPRARKDWPQNCEIILRVLTHHVMILRCWDFYSAYFTREVRESDSTNFSIFAHFGQFHLSPAPATCQFLLELVHSPLHDRANH
jgi:hypothetical protein